MFKFRYSLRLIITYITRFKGILFVGIVLGASIFFIFRSIIPIVVIKKEKIGLTGRYHTDDLPNFILLMISDGLTKIDETGTVEPSLAFSWETIDRGKTWIFHLRNDYNWHDETRVTSETVNYEFSDVEIERPDDKTITFKLQDQFIPFPSVVSKPTFRKGLLGTGKWKVEKIILAGAYVQELVLTKVNKEVKTSRPIEKKIFKFYPTTDRTKVAFKLGEVDKIYDLIDPSPFDSWNTVNTTEIPDMNQVVTLFFNTQDSLISDKSFRQALYYAIDKDSLGKRAISLISPNSWAYNPQVKKYSYNQNKALEIIKDLELPDTNNHEIKLVSTPSLLGAAEEIAEDWKEIGIKTVIQVSSIIPDEFQAFLTIYDIPSDPDQYAIWHSTQIDTNISKYSSPRIDKLLEDGRITLDFEERKKHYLDFQRFILEEAPAAFLYHPTYYTISRK
jgi:peptide/nickel transport system substrate-binding protein